MTTPVQILHAVKLFCGTCLAAGLILLALGLFGSGANVAAVGIGAVIAAVLLFVMGLFFAAAEEQLQTAGGRDTNR